MGRYIGIILSSIGVYDSHLSIVMAWRDEKGEMNWPSSHSYLVYYTELLFQMSPSVRMYYVLYWERNLAWNNVWVILMITMLEAIKL